MKKVLLDTCALIWLTTGDRKLSNAARKIIAEAEYLCYSSVSIWEIARKVEKGILEMPVSPLVFSSMLYPQYGAKSIAVDNAISLKAASLPEIHKDPADRFIIATAMLNDCQVITGDHNFPLYGITTIN